MSKAPSLLSTFVQEVADLLEQIEATALALEAADDPELIHPLFRAFHTLKGASGVAGVATIATFTHHVETAMDRVRSGHAARTPAMISQVLAAKDHVGALLAEATEGRPCDHARGAQIVAQLDALTRADAIVAIAAPPAPAPAPAPVAPVEYLVTFVVTGDPAEVDATSFEPAVHALGEVDLLSPLPEWKAFVRTAHDTNALRDAFIFVDQLGTLTIEPGLCEFGDFAAEPEPTAPIAPAAAAPVAKAKAADSTVRVSSERLDGLVKLIGELVITQSRLEQAYASRPSPELAGPVEAMERLIAVLRDGVLGLRMVPIGTLFTRFHRLARDLSSELGKELALVTAGDDTELDKSVIDQLADALVHILRNSMDHGLEPPAEREAAGKPRRGTIRLAAAQEGSHVVITIADDGRGIDADAVRRKAEAQGLIEPGAVLAEQDTLALIMRPGFSTAAAVTQISGRGVGMDVVKRTIEELRGTIAIASTRGAGTTIKLTLPLTLAIIDGLLVEIDGDHFIVPMGAVTENLELSAAERRANNGRNAVALRGELVPYIRLRELFDVARPGGDLEKIVVVDIDGHRVGLVVDKVIGNHQTVIQPLGRFYKGVELFSGTTILGDGRVAMILDLAGTIRVNERGRRALAC